MQRLGIYVTCALLAACGLIFVKGEVPIALLSGIATGLAVPAIDAALSNGTHLRLVGATLRNYRREVRVSVSYLYRIEDRGRFMLIAGHRLPQFQPVGGVYKFNESARAKLQEWGARTDDLIPIDEVSADDLRLRIPGRHLSSFVRWFESEKSREVGPWREFHEELVKPGIVPQDIFPHVQSDFVRRHYGKVTFSKYSQCDELLIADIFELVPNAAQRDYLRTLSDTKDLRDDLIWAESEIIKRHGAVPGQAHSKAISSSSEWTIR